MAADSGPESPGTVSPSSNPAGVRQSPTVMRSKYPPFEKTSPAAAASARVSASAHETGTMSQKRSGAPFAQARADSRQPNVETFQKCSSSNMPFRNATSRLCRQLTVMP
eukprot:Amastigsp_a841418_285.p4 type:complete len:109 gc:universal Amastigsp_a841418_285:928-1254(+)